MIRSDDQTLANSPCTPDRDVAVLGCGNMGSAMVRALLAAERRVVVWNRTAERAQALAGDGAEVRASAAEAVVGAPLAIFCLGSTESVLNVLADIGAERLTKRTVLNLTSGTPDDARTLRDWTQARGIRYVDGAILAYPEQLGTQPARILVSGDEDVWNAARSAVIDLAGSSMYVGADHSAANAIDAAFTGAFYISSLVSFIEATRFMEKFGVSHDVVSSLLGYGVSVLERQMRQILSRIADRKFSTDQATLNVYADASAAFAAGLNGHGGAAVIEAAAQVLRRAVDAGLGDDDIAAVVTLGS